jgi:PST family polysaccharide transporter
MGMVATLTAFFQVFSDLGLSLATVQRRDITLKQVDNLFWINSAFGCSLAAACVFGGPHVARFYGRGELTSLVGVCGVGFIFSGLAAQPEALLRRQLRFGPLAGCNILAQAAGAIFGIFLALSGVAVWALVGQSLVTQLVLAIGLFSASRYRPGLPRLNPETLGMLQLGGYLTGYNILMYFARNLDNVLIGRYWGAQQLGYYSRAYFLMLLPSSLAAGALAGVTVPALSVLASDRERMAAAYRKCLRVIATVGFPAAVGLLASAPETIRLVYGPRWAPVVPLLSWLCIASVTQPVYITIGWLYMSCGKTKAMLLWGMVASGTLAVAFVLGVQKGAVGVAMAYGLAMPIGLTVPALYCAHRAARLALAPSLRVVARPFLSSLAMGGIVWAAGFSASWLGASWRQVLLVKVTAGVLSYGLLCGPRRLLSVAAGQ